MNKNDLTGARITTRPVKVLRPSYHPDTEWIGESHAFIECVLKMDCRWREPVHEDSLSRVAEIWQDHRESVHGLLPSEKAAELFTLGMRVSVPGGRIGKIVDIDVNMYYPYLVRFEFDGEAYKAEDLKPAPEE